MLSKRALYFYVGRSSFVRKDIEIFSKTLRLVEYDFHSAKKWKTPFQLIHQFFFLILRIWKTDIVFVQLAGYHSLLPVLISKIARKKSVIIAGGTDCHSFPSIRYGNYQKKLVGFFTRLSLKNCSHILPKHESLWYCNYEYTSDDYPKQGIRFFNPGIKTPYTVIENGFDSNLFRNISEKKPNSFLTIAGGKDIRFLKKLKGIDLVIEMANRFPQYSFTIVGAPSGELSGKVPENIQLMPSIPNDQLPEIYSRHSFYFQLSIAEGFPNTLCESMLCECIPIGSGVFSIPEIIGETGYILKRRNTDDLKELIEKAVAELDSHSGKKCRERIIKNFSIENRKIKLTDFLNRIMVTN